MLAHKDKVQSQKSFRIEIICITILLIIYLFVTIIASSRLYPVWMDEVMLSDPAVNLYLGNGFTSSAWWHQPSTAFHAGTSLLYPLLLYVWLKLFGFSLEIVRSFNYFLITVSIIVIWLAIIRLKIIHSPWIRISLLISIILSESVSLSYISTRYDSLGIFLCSIILLIATLSHIYLRLILLIALGFLFPLTGLMLVAYSAILIILIIVYSHGKYWKESLALSFGIVLGGLSLYQLYSHQGVWDSYLIFINNQSYQKLSLIPKILRVFVKDSFCNGLRKDYSSIILFQSLLILAAYKIIKKRFHLFSFVSFGLLIVMTIPIGMCGLGRYPLYYSWTTFIPLAISVCVTFDQILSSKPNKKLLTIFWAIFMLSIVGSAMVGFPSYFNIAVKYWHARDYNRVNDFIEQYTDQEDYVLGDYSIFYAIKKNNIPVIFPLKTLGLTSKEKEQINVVIMKPNMPDESWQPNLENTLEFLGGDWEKINNKPGEMQFRLSIYRRTED